LLQAPAKNEMSCCGAVSSESVVAKQPHVGKGKIALVTGANTGIGKLTAQALARVGFNVVIAGRTISALETAKKDIDQAVGLKDGSEGGRVTILKTPLDLGSVASIKAYAQDFLEQKLALHVLVNNAGVSSFPGKTKEGLDYTMGVNWFGGFLLTNLLLDVIKASEPSRIIIVSSSLNRMATITAANLDKLIYTADGFSDFNQAYCDSKLANILHAQSLAKRLAGTKVSVFSLHPGVVRTDFTRNLSCCAKCMMSVFTCCLRNPSQGASTSVYCAIAEGLEKHSGEYFADCAPSKPSNAAARDEKVAEALWAKGEELTQKFAS